jgi:hypothetical protein
MTAALETILALTWIANIFKSCVSARQLPWKSSITGVQHLADMGVS